MIVADTSALISLASAKTLETVLQEFDVHSTETVVRELEETADYDDTSAEASRRVLKQREYLTIHGTEPPGINSSRIDEGEGTCMVLARETEADFLLTDDLRALPELQPLIESNVAISPLVLRALVKRDVLDSETAEEKLDRLASERDWLGAPIYRRAQKFFE